MIEVSFGGEVGVVRWALDALGSGKVLPWQSRMLTSVLFKPVLRVRSQGHPGTPAHRRV